MIIVNLYQGGFHTCRLLLLGIGLGANFHVLPPDVIMVLGEASKFAEVAKTNLSLAFRDQGSRSFHDD
jgi:hypothetical protein